MNVELHIVPPGGGDVEFALELELPAVPHVGEYVMLSVPAQGAGMFRVLYVTHLIETDWGENQFRNPRYLVPVVQIEPIRYAEGRGPANLDEYLEDPRYRDRIHRYPDSGS
jgi:hypothetical protein